MNMLASLGATVFNVGRLAIDSIVRKHNLERLPCNPSSPATSDN